MACEVRILVYLSSIYHLYYLAFTFAIFVALSISLSKHEISIGIYEFS